MNLNELKPIIVLCCDENYFIPAMVCIGSAVKNCPEPLKIHIIIPATDYLLKDKFLKFKDINNLDLEVIIAPAGRFESWRQNSYISKAAYLRLLIPELIQAKKAIYLDCDILVQKNISELYNIDLGDYYIGGVEDYSGPGGPYRKIKVEIDGVYINSGVLLMNIEKMREDNFYTKCIEIQKIVHENSNFADQCIINKYADGKKMILKDEWNFQVMHRDVYIHNWSCIRNRAKIIHFVGSVKPWSSGANPLIERHWKKYTKLIRILRQEKKFSKGNIKFVLNWHLKILWRCYILIRYHLKRDKLSTFTLNDTGDKLIIGRSLKINE